MSSYYSNPSAAVSGLSGDNSDNYWTVEEGFTNETASCTMAVQNSEPSNGGIDARGDYYYASGNVGTAAQPAYAEISVYYYVNHGSEKKIAKAMLKAALSTVVINTTAISKS